MHSFEARHKTLGGLWVIYGVICIIKALWIFLNSTVFTLMWGALLNRVPDPYTWMNLFHLAMLGALILLGVTALFSFVAAGAMLQGSRSDRTLGLIAGFLGVLTGPLGIALGVYTLIVFVPSAASDNYRLPSSA
jgi:hypothetical protein